MLENLKYKFSDDLFIHNPEPKVDIAICSECGWRGSVDDCIKGQDGDWESGYYEVDFCPKCEDGGCIDNYDMTPERTKEWEEWRNKKDLEKENEMSKM